MADREGPMFDRDPRRPLGPVAGPPPDRRPAPANWPPLAGPVDPLDRSGQVAAGHPLPLVEVATRKAVELVGQIMERSAATLAPADLADHVRHPAGVCGLCDAMRAELTRRGGSTCDEYVGLDNNQVVLCQRLRPCPEHPPSP